MSGTKLLAGSFVLERESRQRKVVRYHEATGNTMGQTTHHASNGQFWPPKCREERYKKMPIQLVLLLYPNYSSLQSPKAITQTSTSFRPTSPLAYP